LDGDNNRDNRDKAW